MPVEGRVVHETIERVLAGAGLLRMSGCKETEQIHVAEGQEQEELECLISRNAATLADVRLAEQRSDLQFLHRVKKSVRGISISVVLL